MTAHCQHDEWELEIARLGEQIGDLKSTIQRQASDIEAAAKWARDYERIHGPFKSISEPRMPDFMVSF